MDASYNMEPTILDDIDVHFCIVERKFLASGIVPFHWQKIKE